MGQEWMRPFGPAEPPDKRHCPEPQSGEGTMSPATKTAAIAADKLESKALNQISAEDFLVALNHSGVAAHTLTIWPEKKKLELYTEPENLGKVNVGRIIDIIKGEKKKVELEKHPGYETWRDPREQFVNPVQNSGLQNAAYDVLVDKLAQDIEARIRFR